MSDWMLTLSGPVAQRATLLATLANSGVDVEHEHGPRGFDTDPTVGWIVARHADVDVPTELAKLAGWSLRSHWPTPTCKACSGHSASNGIGCDNCGNTGRTEKRPTPADPLAELRARIAALETRGV